MKQRYNVVNGVDSAFDPRGCLGDRFDQANVELVARNRRVIPIVFEDLLLAPRESVGDRFGKTNAELVARKRIDLCGRLDRRIVELIVLGVKVNLPVEMGKILVAGLPEDQSRSGELILELS